MKNSLIFGLLLSLGCAGAEYEGTFDALGISEDPILTVLANTHETWGSNGTIAPWTKCTDNGPTTQKCLFVRPSVISSVQGGPTRYKVSVIGVQFGASGASSVIGSVQQIAQHITGELNSPVLVEPVTVEYGGTSTVTGVNIKGGTVGGSSGNDRTDNYMSITFNTCISDPMFEFSALPGTYHSCASADVVIDLVKLKTNFPVDLEYSKRFGQLIAKAIVTGMGLARQEFTSGYPSNRSFNTQVSQSGGNYLTIAEKLQLQCVGDTFSSAGPGETFDVTMSQASVCAPRGHL